MRLGKNISFVLVAILGSWAASLAAGFAVLLDYSFRSGSEAAVSMRIPSDVRDGIGLGGEERVVLLVAHAGCPCTRATLSELDRALVAAEGRVEVVVLCVFPEAQGVEWARGQAVWRLASGVLGARVVADPAGRIASRLGVTTSGHVLMYGASGELEFSGGITASRGHEGSSRGRSALEARLSGGSTELATSPVFGCELFDDARAGPEEGGRCR